MSPHPPIIMTTGRRRNRWQISSPPRSALAHHRRCETKSYPSEQKAYDVLNDHADPVAVIGTEADGRFCTAAVSALRA